LTKPVFSRLITPQTGLFVKSVNRFTLFEPQLGLRMILHFFFTPKIKKEAAFSDSLRSLKLFPHF